MQHVDVAGNVYEVSILGPNLQTQLTPVIGLIAPGESESSALLPSNGLPRLTVAATLDQPGSLAINRYLDVAGSILAAAESTTPLLADTPVLVNLDDGVVFQSFKITITNSAESELDEDEEELNNGTSSNLLAVLSQQREAAPS